jgi:hypothetical protein
MKTGRLNAEKQRQHDGELARMAVVIRMRPDLSYPEIAKQFACSTSMVQKVARVAGLIGGRGTGRKKQFVAQTVGS